MKLKTRLPDREDIYNNLLRQADAISKVIIFISNSVLVEEFCKQYDNFVCPSSILELQVEMVVYIK